MKNIFKRNKKQNTDDTQNLSENTENTEQLSEENSVEQVTAEEAQEKDDVPSVNTAGRDGGNSKNFKTMAVMVIGIIIMLIGTALAVGRYQQSKDEEKAQEAEKQAQEQKQMATGTKVDIEADKQEMQMYDIPPPADVENAQVASMPAEAQPVERIVEPKQPEYQPQYNNYDGGMVAGRDYAEPAAVQQPQPAPPISAYDDEEDEAPAEPPQVEHSSVLVDVYGAKTVSATQSQETGLGASLKSSQLANGTANKRGDKTMLLMRGTTIPCVLKTKIDSSYQGFATCQLAKDVYSANGKVLLMERGSTVFGEQNVQMTQGKARVSILWSKVETPKGISVSLDSPATGQLGEMGIGAKVNNHFWKRFGGAIMLSVIQDASAIGRSHLEKQNSDGETTNINNTTNTAEQMAEEVLKNTINIPPTAIVHQGTVINIMVARDVDFSSIYKVLSR